MMKPQGIKVQESYSKVAVLVNGDKTYHHLAIVRTIMLVRACGRVFFLLFELTVGCWTSWPELDNNRLVFGTCFMSWPLILVIILIVIVLSKFLSDLLWP